MGLLTRLSARRQLRRSSRESLETFPGWIRTPGDRGYGPPHLPPPPQDLRYGRAPDQSAPVPDQSRCQPPPAPAPTASPSPQSAPPATVDGEKFERFATSAAALINEMLDERDHHSAPPSKQTTPSSAFDPGPAPTTAPPMTPPAQLGAEPERPPAPVAALPAPPLPTAHAAPPASPTSPEPTLPPASPAPPGVAEHSEFPPHPTWPYTRKVRLRQRRRQRKIR